MNGIVASKSFFIQKKTPFIRTNFQILFKRDDLAVLLHTICYKYFQISLVKLILSKFSVRS